MEQYISKLALLAKIERLRESNNPKENNDYAQFELDVLCGYDKALDDVEKLFDTLDVKEVDLEQAIDTYLATYFGGEKEKQDWPFLKKMAIYFANWQKEQFEKNRLKHCNSITNEQAELEQGFVDQHLDKYQRMPTYLDAIEYGMILEKELMMANAIDGDITFDYYGDDDKTYGCIAHDSFCLEDLGLKDTDKVKMIIIKDE